jgi:hypothetical protein
MTAWLRAQRRDGEDDDEERDDGIEASRACCWLSATLCFVVEAAAALTVCAPCFAGLCWGPFAAAFAPSPAPRWWVCRTGANPDTTNLDFAMP